jgi:hypothetical protein
MSKSSSSEAILEGMVAVVLCMHAWTNARNGKESGKGRGRYTETKQGRCSSS